MTKQRRTLFVRGFNEPVKPPVKNADQQIRHFAHVTGCIFGDVCLFKEDDFLDFDNVVQQLIHTCSNSAKIVS